MEGQKFPTGEESIPVQPGHTMVGNMIQRSMTSHIVSWSTHTYIRNGGSQDIPLHGENRTGKAAMFDLNLNKRSGMTGYRANFASL
jgi:hypothetical protein